jgi:hypothetical protein
VGAGALWADWEWAADLPGHGIAEASPQFCAIRINALDLTLCEFYNKIIE